MAFTIPAQHRRRTMTPDTDTSGIDTGTAIKIILAVVITALFVVVGLYWLMKSKGL